MAETVAFYGAACASAFGIVDQTLRAALSGIAQGAPVIDHTTVLPSNVP